MNRRFKSAVKRLITLLRLLPVDTNNFLNLPPFSLFNISPFHYYSRIFKWFLSISLNSQRSVIFQFRVLRWYSGSFVLCKEDPDFRFENQLFVLGHGKASIFAFIGSRKISFDDCNQSTHAILKINFNLQSIKS